MPGWRCSIERRTIQPEPYMRLFMLSHEVSIKPINFTYHTSSYKCRYLLIVDFWGPSYKEIYAPDWRCCIKRWTIQPRPYMQLFMLGHEIRVKPTRIMYHTSSYKCRYLLIVEFWDPYYRYSVCAGPEAKHRKVGCTSRTIHAAFYARSRGQLKTN